MASSYVCPICGREMVVFTPTCLGCTSCQIQLELQQKLLTVSPTAPRYVREICNFVDICYQTQPEYVLSEYVMSSRNFEVDKCLFAAPRNPSDKIHVMDTGSPIPSKYKCLIAGKGQYALHILEFFRCAVNMNFEVNPLAIKDFNTPGETMCTLSAVASIKESDPEVEDLMNAYYSNSLERMVDIMYPRVWFGSKVDLLDEYQALYAHVFCQPSINIGWDVGKEGMRNRIQAFIKACLNDLDEIDMGRKPVLKKVDFPAPIDSMWDEYRESYFMSMPSTAVNVYKAPINIPEDEGMLDILNHEIVCDYYLTEELPEFRQLMTLYNACTHLAKMWKNHNTEPQGRYGLEQKRNYLYGANVQGLEKMITNQLVLEFWKLIRKDIQNERD